MTRILTPLGRALVGRGIGPNAVTAVGTLGTVVSALFFFPLGQLTLGALVITVFVLFDLLDGVVARLGGQGARPGGLSRLDARPGRRRRHLRRLDPLLHLLGRHRDGLGDAGVPDRRGPGVLCQGQGRGARAHGRRRGGRAAGAAGGGTGGRVPGGARRSVRSACGHVAARAGQRDHRGAARGGRLPADEER
ncbi:CDP-alcohol phosphatidyltransferase family protein [Nonomuraea antimicrobica]